MGLSISRDYGPITLGDIRDLQGNPAAIDGTPAYTNVSGGTIVTAQGDPRTLPDGSQAFPDGTLYFAPTGAVGEVVHFDAEVDVDLNPNITTIRKIASFDDVLVGGDAAVASINLGAGIPKL